MRRGQDFRGWEHAAALSELAVVLPDNAATLAKRGVCPLCGSGPFRALAIHVPRKHGLPVRWLADALGLAWDDALIARDLRQKKAVAGRDRFTTEQQEAMRAGFEAAEAKSGVSPAGRANRGKPGRAAKERADAAFAGRLADDLCSVQERLRRAQQEVAELLGERAALIGLAEAEGVPLSAIARGIGLTIQAVHHAARGGAAGSPTSVRVRGDVTARTRAKIEGWAKQEGVAAGALADAVLSRSSDDARFMRWVVESLRK